VFKRTPGLQWAPLSREIWEFSIPSSGMWVLGSLLVLVQQGKWEWKTTRSSHHALQAQFIPCCPYARGEMMMISLQPSMDWDIWYVGL